MVLNKLTADKHHNQIDLLQQRRYLVLYLPNWPTDFAKRHDAGLATPLVLYERIKGGLRLAALDALAAKHQLRVGQNLADARALVPGLTVREIDRPLLEAVFADLADWHSNTSPLVAVMREVNSFGDLVLDITGVAHLFGGEGPMLRIALKRLRDLGYNTAGAIASTIGAAWAASHFARSQIVPTDQINSLLDALPVAALRLSATQIAGLEQMGLKLIGQLRGRDRKTLQARFGLSLLQRLDQAYGLAEERLTPRLPVAERYAERRFPDPVGLMDDVLMTAQDRRFPDPVGLMDDVLMTAQDLAIQLAIRLEAEGVGAQTFHLFLYRVDHKVMTLSVNAGSATRDPVHIAKLFSHRSERLEGAYDAGFGIDMIRLAASSISALEAAQWGAFDANNGTNDLDQLYDRMSSRLGPLAVLHSKFVNTHIPEQAVRLEPVIARTPIDPLAAPDSRLPRPLRLLPVPEPITVLAEVPDAPPTAMIWRRVSYKFAKASGPERLGVEWWGRPEPLELVPPDDDEKQAAEEAHKRDGLWQEPNEAITKSALPYAEGENSRDYYIAEDESGRRFWLFRQGLYGFAEQPRWFLQGLFS